MGWEVHAIILSTSEDVGDVLQKQFHKVVQSEKVFLVLTLGRVSSFF